MKSRLIEPSLFITTLLLGLYAGTGFFILMGGLPAIRLMSDRTFAEYWQHTDLYMAKRMSIFGPLMLFSVLISMALLIRHWRSAAFWYIALALLIIVTDMAVIFNINHPLNRTIQGWDLNSLPASVLQVKLNVIEAFQYRSACMIGSFVCALLAVFSNKTQL